MIIAIDIDGVLCIEVPVKPGMTTKEIQDHYRTAIPIKKNIRKINKLGKKNVIVIFTSRWPEDKEITENWLKENKVSHHELILGKPYFDIYIDEKKKILGVEELE